MNVGGPGAAAESRLDIRESEFSQNSAVVEGGAFDLIIGGRRRYVEVVSVVDCPGAGNTASSAAAVYQQNQGTKTRVSLSEADVLLGAADERCHRRWAFISFRTTSDGPAPTPAHVTVFCVAQLAKGGCASQGREPCLACAKTHNADLVVVNCTTHDAVKLYSRHEAPSVAQAGGDPEACEVPVVPPLQIGCR